LIDQDRPLHEDAVLVERDERAERKRGESIEQQSVGRAIAIEDPDAAPFRRSLGTHLIGLFAERKSLALGEDVGVEQVVVVGAAGRRQRVEGVRERDEVRWDEPLLPGDQLIETVLAVVPGSPSRSARR